MAYGDVGLLRVGETVRARLGEVLTYEKPAALLEHSRFGNKQRKAS
jgi:hypothetical protein